MPKAKTLRNTRQRQAVLDALCKTDTHPTAAEVHEMVRSQLPRISLGTVYRNLEVLVRLGLARRLEIGGSEIRFDGDTRHHHHVRCLACGRIQDVHESVADTAALQVKKLQGYRIRGHRLEFCGICPQCDGR